MKGISPLIASVLLIAITMTLAAILATFVSNYTRQQLNALPSCVGGTLTFATNDYPQYSANHVKAILQVDNVDLSGFTVQVITSSGSVVSGNTTTAIKAGSAGNIDVDFTGQGVAVGNKAKVIAMNCPTVSTDWVALK